jgi:iron complex transport system substrate-binding protein
LQAAGRFGLRALALPWVLAAAAVWLPAAWGQAPVAGDRGHAVVQDSRGDTIVEDDRGKPVRFPAPPQRIVSLLPSLTETVCALGACARLVGTDRHSNHPAEVAALPKLGGLDDAQLERIVALKPDLVLAAGSSRVIDRLESLGLRVLVLEPKNLADTERVIIRIGAALGDGGPGRGSGINGDAPSAALVWQGLQARIDAAAARVPVARRGQTVYFEVDSTPYAAGPASFVGELLARLGLVNVVPGSMGPFPKLNPEFVVRARPQIVMATRQAVADMPRRPGWSTLPALQQGQVCGFEAYRWDPLVRPGPRLADAADTLVACLAGLPPPKP